jgi:hypothetical protein
MKPSIIFGLISIAVMVSGCTLFYSGRVATGDNQKAVAVSKLLEAEYARQGLEPVPEPSVRNVYYLSDWASSATCTNYRALCVEDCVNDETLVIEIVPQPHFNDSARAFGEHMQSFATNSFPNLQWRFTSRYEPDIGR